MNITMQKGMLIRRPVADVFRAFVDPTITTKFWFTKSTGRIAPDARVTWSWEMYGVSADVAVVEYEENRRFVIALGDPARATRVEFRFIAQPDMNTYLQITETGYSGTGDQIVAHALDSMGGFALLIASAKALLEHDVILNLVRDHKPANLQL